MSDNNFPTQRNKSDHTCDSGCGCTLALLMQAAQHKHEQSECREKAKRDACHAGDPTSIGKGILKKSQTNGSYDGTPTVFVSSGGQDAVQGFATAEPYIWSHLVRTWDKPLKYQLIADAGFNFYQQALAVRKGDLTKLTPCLKKLVPIMQQAIVDYIANPSPTEKLILQLVTAYNNGWVYTQGTADYAVATMKKLGIVGDAPDGTLGAFTDSRVQQLIGILTPIYAKQGKQTLPGLKPSDIVTNQFIDPSISLKL